MTPIIKDCLKRMMWLSCQSYTSLHVFLKNGHILTSMLKKINIVIDVSLSRQNLLLLCFKVIKIESCRWNCWLTYFFFIHFHKQEIFLHQKSFKKRFFLCRKHAIKIVLKSNFLLQTRPFFSLPLIVMSLFINKVERHIWSNKRRNYFYFFFNFFQVILMINVLEYRALGLIVNDLT